MLMTAQPQHSVTASILAYLMVSHFFYLHLPLLVLELPKGVKYLLPFRIHSI